MYAIRSYYAGDQGQTQRAAQDLAAALTHGPVDGDHLWPLTQIVMAHHFCQRGLRIIAGRGPDQRIVPYTIGQQFSYNFV